ncbi:MAG: hypothetical protein EZS28_049369, partial [Streblomastix strix]
NYTQYPPPLILEEQFVNENSLTPVGRQISSPPPILLSHLSNWISSSRINQDVDPTISAQIPPPQLEDLQSVKEHKLSSQSMLFPFNVTNIPPPFADSQSENKELLIVTWAPLLINTYIAPPLLEETHPVKLQLSISNILDDVPRFAFIIPPFTFVVPDYIVKIIRQKRAFPLIINQPPMFNYTSLYVSISSGLFMKVRGDDYAEDTVNCEESVVQSIIYTVYSVTELIVLLKVDASKDQHRSDYVHQLRSSSPVVPTQYQSPLTQKNSLFILQVRIIRRRKEQILFLEYNL